MVNQLIITKIIKNDFYIRYFLKYKMENNSYIIYTMEVEDPWFSYIYSGIKPVEGRKMSSTWMKIKVGDKIFMYNKVTQKSFTVKVLNIKYYPADLSDDPLTAYLLDVGIDKALPGIGNLNDARNIYLQWSTMTEIKQQGFMGIYVKLDN